MNFDEDDVKEKSPNRARVTVVGLLTSRIHRVKYDERTAAGEGNSC